MTPEQEAQKSVMLELACGLAGLSQRAVGQQWAIGDALHRYLVVRMIHSYSHCSWHRTWF